MNGSACNSLAKQWRRAGRLAADCFHAALDLRQRLDTGGTAYFQSQGDDTVTSLRPFLTEETDRIVHTFRSQ